MPIEFLHRVDAPDIACRFEAGTNKTLPPIMFFHGLWSDMEGTKASHLSDFCASRGQDFIRFDCRGHGRSGGDFKDASIGLWLDDALAVLDRFVDRPAILVGSSMGGWLMLLTALARPDKTKALVGLAAAPDFTKDIEREMSAAQRAALARDGFFDLHEDIPFPCPITKCLLEDGEARCVLDKPMPIAAPVHLIHGKQDAEVSCARALDIQAALGGKATLHLQENGDHSLSSPDDLALLCSLMEDLSA